MTVRKKTNIYKYICYKRKKLKKKKFRNEYLNEVIEVNSKNNEARRLGREAKSFLPSFSLYLSPPSLQPYLSLLLLYPLI
jgi:hypothetical protein